MKTPLPLSVAVSVAVLVGASQVVAGNEPTEPVVRVFETGRAAVGKARPKTRLAVTPPAHPAVGPLNYGEILVRISAPGMRGTRDAKMGAWQLETVRPLIPGTTRVFMVQAELVRVRLVEAAQRAGAGFALLVQGAGDVPWSRIEGELTIGISAGASAPEKLVLEVLDALSARFETRIEEDPVAQENIVFKLPTAVGG